MQSDHHCLRCRQSAGSACNQITIACAAGDQQVVHASPLTPHPSLQAGYRALWIAVEFARAPLPAFWSATRVGSREESADGSADGSAEGSERGSEGDEGGERILYTHAEGGVLTRTTRHPLADTYADIASRYMAAVRGGKKSLSLNPSLAWFQFAVNGEVRYGRDMGEIWVRYG